MKVLEVAFAEKEAKMLNYVSSQHPELEGNLPKVVQECVRSEFLRGQMERLGKKRQAQESKDKLASLSDEQAKRLISKMCDEPEELKHADSRTEN